MKKTTNDWLISAENDIQLNSNILHIEQLTHLIAFHAQQAIEKSFKAIIEEFDLGFVKTHSLEMLYGIIKNHLSIDFNYDLLILLDQLYIDARYPGEMGLLPNGKPTSDDACEFHELSKIIWLEANKICQ